MMKKVIEDNKDIFLSLLQFRNTPIFENKSPNEILMSRCSRNPLLPIKTDKLKPHLINTRKYSDFLKNKQQAQATHYYNKRKGAKELSVIEPNSRVWIQLKPKSIWRPGTVLNRIGERRYKVMVDDKNVYVRNRKFIRPSSLKLCNQNKQVESKKVTWSRNLISERKEENITDDISVGLETIPGLAPLKCFSNSID